MVTSCWPVGMKPSIELGRKELSVSSGVGIGLVVGLWGQEVGVVIARIGKRKYHCRQFNFL